MLVNSKVMAAAATLMLVTGAGVASAMTPALASPGHNALAASGHEVCDEGSPVKCLNAWGGGPSVRTYSPNVSNDNFVVQGVNRCNNGDYTTSNCPISGNPSGLYIYQIEFVGGGPYNGDCVGDNNPGVSGLAELVGCGNHDILWDGRRHGHHLRRVSRRRYYVSPLRVRVQHTVSTRTSPTGTARSAGSSDPLG